MHFSDFQDSETRNQKANRFSEKIHTSEEKLSGNLIDNFQAVVVSKSELDSHGKSLLTALFGFSTRE